MADLPAPTVLNQVLAVLREALEGPAQRWSYFTDTSPGTGLVGTLTPLTAAAALARCGGHLSSRSRAPCDVGHGLDVRLDSGRQKRSELGRQLDSHWRG